jgi:subtilisin family serine protease
MVDNIYMKKIILSLLIGAHAFAADEPKPVEDPDMVKIAIVDTGIDMKSNWEQLKLTPKVCGSWNFVTKKVVDGKEVDNLDVSDEHGHGTHIAGIVTKFAGTAPTCLYIMKYYNSKGLDADNLKNTIKSFKKAVELNVDIINYSGGGIARSDEECAVLKEALDKGIIVVAAAGNERSDVITHKYWPAMCDSRIVAVTATYADGEKTLPSSNTSSDESKVLLYKEIGNDVLSTLPGGLYGYMTGTSQAAATMTGKLANHLYIMRKSHYGRLLVKKAGGWAK